MSAYAGINWKKEFGSEPPMPYDLSYADIYALFGDKNTATIEATVSISASTLTITAPDTTTVYNGIIVVEEY
jgi:hypothetical protein